MSPSEPAPTRTSEQAIPMAVPSGGGLGWIAWVLPIATLVLTSLLLLRARPETVVVEAVASSGYGLEEGSLVRMSGVTVGELKRVAMEGRGRVRFGLELEPDVADVCTEGAALHVVRARVSASGATGLETLVGPRSLVLSPGIPGAVRLQELPVLDTEPPRALRPEGLRVTLTSPSRQGIASRAPILFRGVRVGEIEDVRLAGDASAVLLEAWIEPGYEGLVQDTSQWWEVSGIELGLSLTGGVQLGLETLETALTGGVAFATGPGGAPVGTGATFALQSEAEDSWREWRTPLVIGAGADLVGVPTPVLARQRWVEPGLLDRERAREGWLVPFGGALWGPRSLLQPVDGARDGRTELEVRGARLVLSSPAGSSAIASVPDPAERVGAPPRRRAAKEGEEALLLLGERVLPVARSAWVIRGDAILLRTGFDAGPLLGGLVVGREDGDVLGVLGGEVEGLHRLLPLP